MDDLRRLADLLGVMNAVAGDIAALIGRPTQIGHVGEYIASRVFDIQLAESASNKCIDGYFRSGPLAGRSVNIKWTTKNDGLLNLAADSPPHFYLVLAGPKTAPGSSRGTHRPWVISAAFLFDGAELHSALLAAQTKIGVATSVRQRYWQAAEIYPEARNARLVLSDEQRAALTLFGPEGVASRIVERESSD